MGQRGQRRQDAARRREVPRWAEETNCRSKAYCEYLIKIVSVLSEMFSKNGIERSREARLENMDGL